MSLQLFVLDNIYLGGYIIPCLYLLFIAMLPTSMAAIPMMLVAFGTGLIVDVSSNMLGFNVFACTAVAFLRGAWLDKFIRGENDAEVETPSIRTVPYQQYLPYLFLLMLVYNFLYHLLLVFDLRELPSILLTTLLSTIVSWLLALLYQLLLFRKDKKTDS